MLENFCQREPQISKDIGIRFFMPEISGPVVGGGEQKYQVLWETSIQDLSSPILKLMKW